MCSIVERPELFLPRAEISHGSVVGKFIRFEFSSGWFKGRPSGRQLLSGVSDGLSSRMVIMEDSKHISQTFVEHLKEIGGFFLVILSFCIFLTH